MNQASSFRLANDQPIIFKNYAKATSVAKAKYNIILEKDPEDLIKEIYAGKRKRDNELKVTKKTKQSTSKRNIVMNSSLESPVSSSNNDDFEWDEFDDSEISRAINESTSHIKPTPDLIDSLEENKKQSSKTTPSSNSIQNDDELEWSDDDSEFLTNVSLLEQSITSSSSKLDRSALQEISNL